MKKIFILIKMCIKYVIIQKCIRKHNNIKLYHLKNHNIIKNRLINIRKI